MTFVYTYYNNPGMLAIQYAVWERYVERLGIEIIIVDDGSKQPAIDVPRPDLPIRIYRVTDDTPWHQDGARNLGAHVARDGWIFFGDMDHVVPWRTASLFDSLDPSACYRFPRKLASGDTLRPAVNIFACTREMFWRVGGYDERLCGAYGSDRVFIARMDRHAARRTFPGHVDVHLPADVPDCATRGLDRTGEANRRKLDEAIRAGEGNPPLVLNFEWERVA